MFWSVLSHNWLGNDQGLAKKRTGTKSSMENNMAASDFGNEIEKFFNLFFLQIFLFFIFASQREPLIAYKYSGSLSRSWHFNVSIATLRSMLHVVLVMFCEKIVIYQCQ